MYPRPFRTQPASIVRDLRLPNEKTKKAILVGIYGKAVTDFGEYVLPSRTFASIAVGLQILHYTYLTIVIWENVTNKVMALKKTVKKQLICFAKHLNWVMQMDIVIWGIMKG